MASYAEQVIICTGNRDWTSNLEDEVGDTGDFVRGMKSIIGKGSAEFDPFNRVLLTASSMPKSPVAGTTTALLFPQFKKVSYIQHENSALSAFATAYLKAKTLHRMHDGLPETQKASLLRDESFASQLEVAEQITTPTILICGHAGRDLRCGILGPILQKQFEEELQRKGIDAQVAQISHIGGHKFAGNVIMYVPPTSKGNALRGSGIWYGRVGPEHVEGLVEETLLSGRVVLNLLRGGVIQDGGDIGRIVEEQVRRDGGEMVDVGKLTLRPRPRVLDSLDTKRGG